MIHIRELYRLKNIGSLRLIAGSAGLERTVTAAVLFEYDPSRMQLADFYRGDLVVTTLAYARGEAELVASSLLALMDQGIAGLLVKTAYFTRLPDAVIEEAERLGTPIFLFDDTYIEEVILEVTELIRGKRRFAGFEKELDALMAQDISHAQVQEIVSRIDPVGAQAYRLYALYAKARVPGLDEQLYALLRSDAALASRLIVLQWRRMFVVISHAQMGEQEDEAALMEDVLLRAGAERASLSVGVSGIYGEQSEFSIALREAVYAARAADLESRPLMKSRELGVYAYLFPMSENPFVCEMCRRSIQRLRTYDAQNHTNLLSTAKTYVAHKMEIAATAKALFQHPNTVRYRLTKIQKLMGMEDDASFAPMISLMIHLQRILGEAEKE